MKVIILVLMAMMFGLVAGASDIVVDESQPTLTVWKLDTVRFLVFTKTCEVYYRKGYMDGEDFVGVNQGRKILFMDKADNLETPENEEITEFTQLIQLINNENDIKASITKAVKIKLGIE